MTPTAIAEDIITLVVEIACAIRHLHYPRQGAAKHKRGKAASGSQVRT
jgi:hypothetical protein